MTAGVVMLSPEDYAHGFQFDLAAHDLLSDRSRHADDGGIGASSFGCREEMRRTLAKVPATDSPDKMSALIGSYIDAGIRQARAAANPNLQFGLKLSVTLYPQVAGKPGFTFPVNPDELDPDEPSCTDYKTKDGLAAIRRGFVEDQARFQRHLQYLAAHQAGLVPPEGVVRNVFIDRSGSDQRVHVEQEPFSWAVIEEATEFLNDALYAAKHGEEAFKDRPRVFCKNFCRWFSDCRGAEIEIEEITDPDLAARVDAVGDARAAAKVETAVADALLNDGLRGLTGRTDRYSIVSKWVNSVKQEPHWRVELEELPTAVKESRDSAA